MSDQWEVAWSATARRHLSQLPEKVATSAIEFIYGALADNPSRVGRALRFELEGHHSARRGDYRVLYTIDSDAHRATIRAIEHRSDVYRKG
ncbi:MAG TPA: type II toxin-antitoxin system RelE/ParE family toxin [Acidimicrobiales bacterium]|nr:type II toxin-antitoxin system RelE/ParE family toxin [Acidimicrobiales bacterium]